MKFKIHFTWNDGTDDCFEFEGDTVESIRKQADEAFELRSLTNPQPWSEEIS